jgi:hypothetical protein
MDIFITWRKKLIDFKLFQMWVCVNSKDSISIKEKKFINFFQNQTVVEFFGCKKRMKNKSKLLMRSYEKPVNTSETVFNSDIENLSNNITILKKNNFNYQKE